jgi:enoyl-CoA hydratase/carnithine racemase
MPDDDLVLADDADAIRTLVLNRPDQLNAFNQALCAALTEALDNAATDDAVHVVVVTGAGRAFSAGTDLLELAANGDFRGTPDDPQRFERLVDALVDFPKPLICAVNGIGVGIGATMLGLADLVVMSDSARLRCPFTSLSLAPEVASSATFPFLLGRQAAAWMLLSSEWIDAAEAKAMGLAWKVVPSDEVLDEAVALARKFALQPLGSLVASKRLIAATFADSVAAGRRRENAAFDVLLETPEHRAAVDAFVSARTRANTGAEGGHD